MLLHPDLPRGMYLWGGVGRGKSFLMDSFYAVIPLKRKTRVHFHEFMRDVHRALDEEKNVENPLDIVAAKIARRFRLICFDEFHVSDIADAMILYNLMQALFDRGVCFVITSNYQTTRNDNKKDIKFEDNKNKAPKLANLFANPDFLEEDEF
jgi:cell division protein ZapE